MTLLPPKRNRSRSGIEREPRRVWLQHRRWVRSHACAVRGCKNEPIEFAHVRSAANAGIGLKPHDAYGIPLCSEHHRRQHQIGQAAFERKYGIDLEALAGEFTRRSPDSEMRAFLQLGRG